MQAVLSGWKAAVWSLALVAACGASLNVAFKSASPQPLDLTLKCAAEAADSLGYKAHLGNHGNSMEAVRKDSVLAPYEDGRDEKLTATGQDAKDGSSTFTVTGATYSLKWTRIGLESQQVPASDRVRADAKTVAARCGGATE
jgi:hypothetical protein